MDKVERTKIERIVTVIWVGVVLVYALGFLALLVLILLGFGHHLI
jgi:hypothetical protein